MSRPGSKRARRAASGSYCLFLAIVALMGTSLWASVAPRATAGLAGTQRLASGVGGITVLSRRPGDPNHLVVGVKEGYVRLLNLQTGQFEPEPFLNLIGQIDSADEGGLMGIAFDPNYQENGTFYIAVTVDNGGIPVDPVNHPGVLSPYTAEVRQYTMSANPNVADPSYTKIIEWFKPQVEHTGGWLDFGRDGYLYVATGDGGGANDDFPGHTPGIGNAQDVTDNLLGKLLRIDPTVDAFPNDPNRHYSVPVDNPFVGVEGDDEIFAYGLRSPWRNSFDRATGDLWIADVGENAREEVNVLPNNSGGGYNFGWRLREGTSATPTEGIGGPPPPLYVEPVYDYLHSHIPSNPAFQGNSVTGGYAYRGPDPSLQGMYIFGDFISGRYWMFDPADPSASVQNITEALKPNAGSIGFPTTFADDAYGNLYIGTLTGNVFRILTDAVVPGDFQADAVVDNTDLDIWAENLGAIGEPGTLPGDANLNGRVNGRDFLYWQRAYGYNPWGVTPPAGMPIPELEGQVLMVASCAGCLWLRGRLAIVSH